MRESLEKTLLSNLEQEHDRFDRLPFHGLPVVLLFSADTNTDDKTVELLRREGEKHAQSFQCVFVDVTPGENHDNHRHNGDSQSLGSGLSSDHHERWFSEEYLTRALHALIEAIQRKASYGQINQLHHPPAAVPDKALNPDIRLLMCFLCGDDYHVDQVPITIAPLITRSLPRA